MKQQNETPRYATLMYDVLHELDITINEYFYLDMVYHLSREGWCYKSLESVANDMKMHKNGVQKMKVRLIGKGLLKKNTKGYVKTTVTYHSVLRQPQKPYHSVTNRNTQCDGTVPLSVTKNNNKNNKEYNKENDFRGAFSPNKEKLRNMLKQKGILKS
jgi:hypothetical protein